ncbi:hypothetical protein Tco_0663383 [Tanacetum coccineum]
MKTKKQPDGDFQCAVCTRFFPDRVSVITHLCWSDHENQLNDDLLLGIAEQFYEPEDEDVYMHQLLVRIRRIQDRVRDIYEQVCRAYIWYDLLGSEEDKIMYAMMSSLMEARAQTLKLELTECLVNLASEFKRWEM